jgi:hypothetical protein
LAIIGSDAFSQVSNNPEEIVKQLYFQYGQGDIVINSPANNRLLDKPLAVYKIYFTEQLAKLIVDDRAEEIKTKEVGRIDFSLLFGSQDTEGVKNIRIHKSPSENTIVVIYDQNNEKDVMKLKYIMTKTKAGWRISDIIYETRITHAFPAPIERRSLIKLLTK